MNDLRIKKGIELIYRDQNQEEIVTLKSSKPWDKEGIQYELKMAPIVFPKEVKDNEAETIEIACIIAIEDWPYLNQKECQEEIKKLPQEKQSDYLNILNQWPASYFTTVSDI